MCNTKSPTTPIIDRIIVQSQELLTGIPGFWQRPMYQAWLERLCHLKLSKAGSLKANVLQSSVRVSAAVGVKATTLSFQYAAKWMNIFT